MKDYSTLYNSYFEKIQDKLFETAGKTQPDSLKLPFEYLIQNGGKRLRPILTMISCGIAGGNPFDSLDYGVAIEILHNFTLVHDDIMDGSPLRRGKDTVHIKWDVPTGILVGDVMIGYACRLMPKGSSVKNADKMQNIFMDGLVVVCEGQAFDMDFNVRKNITVDNYIDMISQKTAKLLSTSVLMGAYTGDANQELIDLMDEFAYSMGIAFQIQDDFLDLQAEAEFGKVKGQDLVEGKKTYMIIRTQESAVSEEDRKLIDKFYENNGLFEEDIPQMIKTISNLGIFDETKNLFEEYYQKAEKALSKMPQNDHTEMMAWLLNKMKNRAI